MDLQFGFIDKLSVEAFRTKLREAATGLNGNTPLLVFENHDRRRSVDRYGDGKNSQAIAKLLATLLMAPRAAVLLYYGQEIGMENNDPKRVEDVLDPIGKRGWPEEKGRDGERTPMQWDASPNAGFSTAAKTWLPVGEDYKSRNVAAQTTDSNSVLNYYKALTRLRRENPALRDGEFQLVAESDANVLCWIRKTSDGQAAVVALNFTASPQTVSLDLTPQGVRGKQASTALSSFSPAGTTVELNKLSLPPYGAFVGNVQ
jgi:alpha-glucosidase